MSVFKQLIGKTVKVPYDDGSRLKVARGILEQDTEDFISLRGAKGELLINKRNINKVSFS